MSTIRTCHICKTETDTWCPTCVEAFKTRRAVETMTVEERIAELEAWGGPLEIPFSLLHGRFEELMGRPVWSHEFAFPDMLTAELRAGSPASMTDIIEKIPEGKQIIVLDVTDESN